MSQPPLTILIVEDNPIFVELLAEALKGAKMTAVSRHVARDAEDAIRKFRAQTPDVTFLDINLPDGSGLELLETFMRITPDAYIVMLTGEAHSDSVFRACAGGAQGYILKPFQPKRIHEVLRTYLSNPRPRPAPAVDRAAYMQPENKPKAPPAPVPTPKPADVIRGWRALAASADADQRADVQWLFNDHGCKLDVCVTGTEAWALLEKNHYDFVLLDSNLTDMDSYQLANQLRLKNTRQPIKSYVLLLTQPWEDENPQKAALAGIGHTLSKPLTDARLERVLTACATDYLDLMGEAFRR